ncbi:uncharacterized protein LOC142219509 [Haematobia irritans]|uniref:uncharacterized protein LOC142219509 n=1 Tax=Haematobia irritans TaxID=7368 RepID=UPI003F4F73A5
MFFLKSFVFLFFLLAICVAISNTSPVCDENCAGLAEEPMCVTFIDGTKKQYKNPCELILDSCKKKISVVEDAEEGPCPK